jgi:hypothetical protein
MFYVQNEGPKVLSMNFKQMLLAMESGVWLSGMLSYASLVMRRQKAPDCAQGQPMHGKIFSTLLYGER